MNIKRILSLLFIGLTLLVEGCLKKDDSSKELEYREVEKVEIVNYLNQVLDENTKIESYRFNIKVSTPKDIFGGADESSEEEIWPDTSDTTKWENIFMEGVVSDIEGDFQAKFSMNYSEENASLYVKDNTVYMNENNNKYKATFDSKDEIEMIESMSFLPNMEFLMGQIEMIEFSESGLKFEKAEKDGKLYYQIFGVAVVDQQDEGFSINMEVPVDINLTFENDKLIAYKYKTGLFAVIMEAEVEITTDAIQFPSDLDSYIENKDAFFEE